MISEEDYPMRAHCLDCIPSAFWRQSQYMNMPIPLPDQPSVGQEILASAGIIPGVDWLLKQKYYIQIITNLYYFLDVLKASIRLLEDASGHCNKNQPAWKIYQNYCERLEK